MSKFKPQLAARMSEESLKQHREASYRDDFDVGRQHTKIHLDKIDRNPHQPRLHFSKDEIKELAESISKVGLLQPISVRPVGDRFQLIAGERRFRAHQHLEKPTIEAIVISVDEAESATLALAENIERQDLTDFEIGESIVKLEQHFPTRKKFADSLGIQKSDYFRYKAFSKLPDAIRARLAINPKLLARSAADDIVKTLKDIKPSPALDARIDDALALLEAGKLYQTKFAEFLRQESIKVARERGRSTFLTNRNGARVGSILVGSDEVVVKIAGTALNAEQLERLQQFIGALAQE